MSKMTLVVFFAAAMATTSIVGAETRAKPEAGGAADFATSRPGLSLVDAANQPTRQFYNGAVYCRDMRSGLFSRTCAPLSAPVARRATRSRTHAKALPSRAAATAGRPPRHAAHAPRPHTRAWTAYCSARHRSFNPRTGLYVTNRGQLRPCRYRGA